MAVQRFPHPGSLVLSLSARMFPHPGALVLSLSVDSVNTVLRLRKADAHLASQPCVQEVEYTITLFTLLQWTNTATDEK